MCPNRVRWSWNQQCGLNLPFLRKKGFMASNYYKSSIFNLQLQNWKTKDIQQSKPEAAERLAGTRSRISCITSVGSTPPLSIARSSRARSDAIAAGVMFCSAAHAWTGLYSQLVDPWISAHRMPISNPCENFADPAKQPPGTQTVLIYPSMLV